MKKIILFGAILFAINFKSLANANLKFKQINLISNLYDGKLINSNNFSLKKIKVKELTLKNRVKKNIKIFEPEINIYISTASCVCPDGSIGLDFAYAIVSEDCGSMSVLDIGGGNTCDD